MEERILVDNGLPLAFVPIEGRFFGILSDDERIDSKRHYQLIPYTLTLIGKSVNKSRNR